MPLLLPRTLAAIHSPELLAALREEVSEAALPLERHLTHGGWPERATITLRSTPREEGEYALVPITVEFIEQCPAACPASSRPETRIAYLMVRIRRSDAVAEIVDD